MSVPVLFSFARHYPQHELVVLSKTAMRPLFGQSPENITFRGVDLKNDYHGLRGLSRLFGELRAERFDAVADLHDVLRSKYLRCRFRWQGIRTAHIDKGRAGKRRLTARWHKRLERQPSSFQRYEDVFARLGYDFPLKFHSIFGDELPPLPSHLQSLTGDADGNRRIGIAPFAAHRGKIYPAHLQEQVIHTLSQEKNLSIFLFGGGKREQEILTSWEKKYPHTVSVAGRFGMDDELRLMSQLDVMITMDSGNMHLASLVGTPVVSIWGATHPYAGFMGWEQDEANAIQEELPCRPCSIYGNKPCRRNDYACLNGIAPERIIDKIKHILANT